MQCVMETARKHLVLVGGGHAHVAVLADWIKNGLPCEQATLLTPSSKLRYSGMVPGWISGQYSKDEGLVDVEALAERAGVHLILDRCTAIDPDLRLIRTGAGPDIAYDLASIDTGGVGQAARLLGETSAVLDIRPIDRFVEQLAALDLRAGSRIAVIGGGAGGTELAFAIRNRAGASAANDVSFVTGRQGLLPDFSDAVRALAQKELARQAIRCLEGDAAFEGDVLSVDGEMLGRFDLILAAMGSGAPEWPGKGGLATDEKGFIAVDQYQRSISHPEVFAVGDVAARMDRTVPHSGVHAVFAGPVLAANLRKAIRGAPMTQSYQPRRARLYLLSTGNGSAIASFGALAARGRWVSWLKHRIDKRWISKYAALAHNR